MGLTYFGPIGDLQVPLIPTEMGNPINDTIDKHVNPPNFPVGPKLLQIDKSPPQALVNTFTLPLMKSVSSLAELAKLAGTSKATVSLALRDHHKISEATRKRIQELAKIHGYRVNPMVSAQMAHVKKTVRLKKTTQPLHLLPPLPTKRPKNPIPPSVSSTMAFTSARNNSGLHWMNLY